MFVIGNWKMGPEKQNQALDLAKKTLALAKTHKKDNISLVVCPPFIHIPSVVKFVKTGILVGAQNVSETLEIAQTSNISVPMLKDYGACYCIVGHSEVRAKGETNAQIAEKVQRLLEKKITPIVCIGEKARDTQGWYLSEIKDQLEAILGAVPEAGLKKIIIAYEPVWAIGKTATREATPLECEEMVIYIRKLITDHTNEKVANSVPILYGGSVDENNVARYASEGKVQGFLVGRVSLDAKRLGLLCKALTAVTVKRIIKK
jgi:triosephosphate isomerase (TIM)